MFRNVRSTFTAAAIALSALVPMGQAIAAPTAVPQPAVAGSGIAVTPVWHDGYRHGGRDRWDRWDRRDRHWDRGWDRPRHGYDRPRYGYDRPRYAPPPPVYRGPVRSGRAHINWCENRYRTYRAWDNTYSPDIGIRAQCISPYM